MRPAVPNAKDMPETDKAVFWGGGDCPSQGLLAFESVRLHAWLQRVKG